MFENKLEMGLLKNFSCIPVRPFLHNNKSPFQNSEIYFEVNITRMNYILSTFSE